MCADTQNPSGGQTDSHEVFPPQNIRIIYILGSGHCGSTMLGLMLGNHEQVACLNEVNLVAEVLGGSRKDRGGVRGSGFWNEVQECFYRRTNIQLSSAQIRAPSIRRMLRWPHAEKELWLEHNRMLYASCLRVSKKSIILDGSKAWQRLYALQSDPRIELNVIELIRDGRAVTNSYLRKYNSVLPGMKRWAQPLAMARLLKRRGSQRRWIRLHYEQLAKDPEREVASVCARLGLTYSPALSEIGPDRHGVGGNRMRFRGRQTITLDETWRRELSFKNRATFEILLGSANRALGYR